MTGTTGRFWLCQSCGKHVPARQEACRCGFSRTEAPEIALESAFGEAAGTSPTWFAVGPSKLVVMSLLTLGLYQVYWFYQQWRRARDAGEDVWPLPRSIFGVLFSYPLFRRIIDSAPDDAPAWGPGALAVAYGLLCISSNLPMPYALVAFLSVLPLVAVQRIASAVAERDFPTADPNRSLTAFNWVGGAVGAALLGLVVWGAFFREKPTSLAFLSRVAAQENASPRDTTSGIVRERVVALEGTLVYSFTVTDEARTRFDQTKPRLQQVAQVLLCREGLVRAGVSVRFVYNDARGGELASATVAPSDCRR